MSAITQWTTPALWTLSVLCLTSRAPVEAAYAAPVLLIVDLFNRSRSLSYARTGKSEYVRQPTGKEKRKVRRLNGETEDPIHVEQVRETGTRWSLLTMVNLALTLALLEPLISSRLITCPDVQYARTSALSNDSARISLRLPGYDQSAIEYRPLVPGYPWTSTIPFHLESSRDWTADVSLDHLQPGIQYEYRAEGLHGAHNFTTFPDSRLESPFRFVFAGQPQFVKQRFRPISHNRQATWAGWLHQIKLDRVRSSAWTALGEWLDDMDGRAAWAATRFALIGNMPKGTKMRQLVASSGKAFERLPILPSRVKSYEPGKGGADGSPFNADPEPAALTVPESHFSYGKVHVFRLQYPHREPHQDDQDWRVDVADLERKLASYNTTDWKFIVTPSSLAPFFSAPYSLREWQDAVLDVLAYVPNVVVLTESSGDFRAEILRRDVIQVTSPSLDGGRHQEPDLTRAREEPVTTYITATDGIQVQQIAFEKVDRLLRQFPAGRANWLTVEIHGARTYVVFVRDSQPIWRLEIVGEQPVSRAVGTVAQSLQNILRRLGLSTTRWF